MAPAAPEIIIYHERQIVFGGQCRKCFEIRDTETWITYGFQKDEFCFIINQFFETGHIIPISKTGFNTNIFE